MQTHLSGLYPGKSGLPGPLGLTFYLHLFWNRYCQGSGTGFLKACLSPNQTSNNPVTNKPLQISNYTK